MPMLHFKDAEGNERRIRITREPTGGKGMGNRCELVFGTVSVPFNLKLDDAMDKISTAIDEKTEEYDIIDMRSVTGPATAQRPTAAAKAQREPAPA